MKSVTNTARCAQRIARQFKMHGLRNVSGYWDQPIPANGRPCRRSFEADVMALEPVDSFGAKQHVRQAVNQVYQPDLLCFIKSVTNESDVLKAITTKVYPGQSYPIELMRRASRIALNSVCQSRTECEVLHVAVLMAGVREALSEQGACDREQASQVLFAIVCTALHRLQDALPEMANTLRIAMGWDCEDATDTEYALWLQRVVERALAAVGMAE